MTGSGALIIRDLVGLGCAAALLWVPVLWVMVVRERRSRRRSRPATLGDLSCPAGVRIDLRDSDAFALPSPPARTVPQRIADGRR